MAAVEIKPVRSSRDRMKFIKMPWSIYKNDPCWVPPLIFEQKEFINPKKGPFFDYGEAALFLAYRGKKAVGRISAHINRRHEEVFKDNKGFFGFFECENNINTARALFSAGEEYLKQKGKKSMEGPFSFSIYDEMGILVEGFDTIPYALNVHNPSYYPKLMEECGFRKSVDWYAFRGKAGITDINVDPRYDKIFERVRRKNSIIFRNIEKKRLDEEADVIKGIFHQAWSRNWGHVDFTEREWERMKNALVSLVVFPLSTIVMVNNEPAGFLLSVYDANLAVQKTNGRLFPFGFVYLLRIPTIRRFRVILMGVLDKYRHLGLEVAMVNHVIKKARELGFTEAEMSNIVETNKPMLDSMSHLHVERYKTYRIYIKDLK